MRSPMYLGVSVAVDISVLFNNTSFDQQCWYNEWVGKEKEPSGK